MASSWPSDSADAIGDNPYHMGAWDKLVLGWSDLATVVNPGEEKTREHRPGRGRSTSGWQALRVNLPNYIQDVTVFPPDGGDPNYYYSGQGDDIETTMRRSLGGAGC